MYETFIIRTGDGDVRRLRASRPSFWVLGVRVFFSLTLVGFLASCLESDLAAHHPGPRRVRGRHVLLAAEGDARAAPRRLELADGGPVGDEVAKGVSFNIIKNLL